MERREFLKICGVTGAGLAVGIGYPGVVAATPPVGLSKTPVSRMMRGSVRMGCARIPDVDYPGEPRLRVDDLPLS